MSQKPISPLRQRMLEDMSLRGFTPDTQRDYVRAVKKLAAFLGRSPDAATAEDLRAFQLHLTASGVQPTNHQHDGDGVAVLLQGNARPAGGQGCSAAQRSAALTPGGEGGFVPRGEAGRCIPERNAAPGGRLSANTNSGGLFAGSRPSPNSARSRRPAITRRPAAELPSKRRCRDRSAAWRR